MIAKITTRKVTVNTVTLVKREIVLFLTNLHEVQNSLKSNISKGIGDKNNENKEGRKN